MSSLRKILSRITKIVDLLNQHEVRGRWILSIIFILTISLLLPRGSRNIFHFEIGKVWQSPDLVAPFDFSIRKDDASYERDKQAALESVYPVFIKIPIQIEQNRAQIDHYFQALIQIQKDLKQGLSEHEVEKRLNLNIPTIDIDDFKTVISASSNPESLLDSLRKKSLELFDNIYEVGYIDVPKSELNGLFASLRIIESHEKVVEIALLYDNFKIEKEINTTITSINSRAAQFIQELLRKYCQPNYSYNQVLYEEERQVAINAVSKFEGKIHKGQLIVANGQRTTAEMGYILRSLENEQEYRSGPYSVWLSFLGHLILVTVLTSLLLLFLFTSRYEVYHQNNRLIFIYATLLLMTLILIGISQLTQVFVKDFNINLFYAAPLCIAPIMITIFLDERIGFFANTFVALLGGIIISGGFEFFFIQACVGTVAVYNLKVLSKRSQLFNLSFLMILVYCLTYLGYELYIHGRFSAINYSNLVVFALNVILTQTAYPIIYLFEKIFSFTSDLTYIELLDTNHPILRELAIKAPGTYQHSLQVANIAEASARCIGANSLKVKVGALFHDIGKMNNPEYFSENQQGGYNPHSYLSPQESAEIIISHIADGVKIAQDYNMPTEIIEFIQTHHGTSRVEYFYRNYIKNDTGVVVPEYSFRYKGPLPTTKEMAILMIADSVEAASRAMNNPTAEQIEELVQKIVSYKISDNQLVDSSITFKELSKVKEEILRIVLNIHHKRIQYPDLVKA
ncbi:MAG: HDIG domain-containing protein [Bacteroidia bacterium]|nr:HDIG domain-containing protein [Bacteroidia bacterium]